MYGAATLELSEEAFTNLKNKWGESYPRAVKVWENHIDHVHQLFNCPVNIRKVIYTTNAIESVHSSLRKVTKKDMFENKDAVYKIFYLRITRILGKKWDNCRIQNWPQVLNQLSCLDSTYDHIAKYLK